MGSALTADLTNAMQISDFGMYLFADLWHDVRIRIEYVFALASHILLLLFFLTLKLIPIHNVMHTYLHSARFK